MAHKLLIVDDEVDFTESLDLYFAAKGFSIITAATGEDAVDVINKENPDVIILDLLLDGKMDGLEVLRNVEGEGLPAKTVILTGSDDALKEKEINGMGIACYLKKPITVKELEAVVNNILQKKND